VEELLQLLLALLVVLAPLAVAWWLLRDRKQRQGPTSVRLPKR
jgi:hypothetical protein